MKKRMHKILIYVSVLLASLSISTTAFSEQQNESTEKRKIPSTSERRKLARFFALTAEYSNIDFRNEAEITRVLTNHEVNSSDPTFDFINRGRLYKIQSTNRQIVDGKLEPEKSSNDWQKEFGCILNWRATGPFENSSKVGISNRLRPEEGSAAPFLGRFGMVDWRSFTIAKHDICSLKLDDFYPSDSGAFVAESMITVQKKSNAVLLISFPGDYKLWVNGEFVGEKESEHDKVPDGDAWQVKLQKGNNIIGLKLGADDDGYAELTVRAVEPRHFKPLSFVTNPSETIPDNELKTSKEPGKPPLHSGFANRLKDYIYAVKKNKVSVDDAMNLASYLRRTSFMSSVEPWVEIANHILKNSLNPLQMVHAAKYINEDWRRSQIIQQAVAKLDSSKLPDDKKLEVLCKEAETLSESSVILDQLKGRKKLETLVKSHPDNKKCVFPLVRYYIRKDLHPLAKTLLSNEKIFSLPEGRDFLRTILDEIGSNEEKRRLTADALKQYPLFYLDSYINRKVEKNDFDAALKRIDLVIQNHGESPSLLVDKAKLLEGSGNLDAAILLLAKAFQNFEGNNEIENAYINALIRANRKNEALIVLKKALSFRPQDESMRRHVASLIPQSVPFYSSFVVKNFRELAQKYPPQPFQYDILVDQKLVYASPNGLTRTFRQLVTRVNRVEGVDEAKYASASYQIGDEQVDIVAVKVYKPDGTVSEEFNTSRSSYTRKDSTTYNDTATIYFEAKGVNAGDLVEFQWIVSEVANENFRGDYFGDLEYLQSYYPIALQRYTILAPDSFKLNFRDPKLKFKKIDSSFKDYLKNYTGNDATKYADDSLDNYHVTSYELTNIPEVESETNAIGVAQRFDYAIVSNKASWNDVGRWWWELAKDQMIVDNAIAEKVAQLTKGLKTEDEKIIAIHDYVVKNTRYLHVGLGIHGWKPYRTTDIFRNRYGDCKDKAILLKVMLEKAGVKANVVLVRTNNLGTMDPKIASMGIFNHAIAYVPSKNLFLDGTAEFNGVHMLPSMDQNAQALIIEDGGESRLVTMPLDPPSENRFVTDIKVQLDSTPVKISGHVFGSGNNAAYFRNILEDKERRREKFESSISATYTGLAIDNAKFSNLDDLNLPVNVDFKGHGGNFVLNNGSVQQIYPRGVQTSYAHSFAPKASRNQPLRVGVPYEATTKIEWVPPKGLQFEKIPDNVDLKRKFGSLSLSYELKSNGHLLTTTTITMLAFEVPTPEYPEFRKFILEIDQHLNTPITLMKK